MSKDHESTVSLRIELRGLPPRHFGECRDVEAGIQCKKDVLPGIPQEDGSIWLPCELRVKRDAKSGEPRFLGPYAFGSPAERFLYVSWSGVKGGKREMFRRMKIPLAAITSEQIEKATAKRGAVIAAAVAGTARDGGPACATVPLLGGGWSVRSR